MTKSRSCVTNSGRYCRYSPPPPLPHGQAVGRSLHRTPRVGLNPSLRLLLLSKGVYIVKQDKQTQVRAREEQMQQDDSDGIEFSDEDSDEEDEATRLARLARV